MNNTGRRATELPYTYAMKGGAIPQLWAHYVYALMITEDGSRQDNEKRAAAIIYERWMDEPAPASGAIFELLTQLAGEFDNYRDNIEQYAYAIDPPATPATDDALTVANARIADLESENARYREALELDTRRISFLRTALNAIWTTNDLSIAQNIAYEAVSLDDAEQQERANDALGEG